MIILRLLETFFEYFHYVKNQLQYTMFTKYIKSS
eukprot:UN09289